MRHPALLSREGTALIVIDVQEKLYPHVLGKEAMLKNIVKLVTFAQRLSIPVVLTEQYPKGLGATVGGLKSALGNYNPIEKTAFSAFGCPEFDVVLKRLGAKTLAIVGIEAHVCVCQTALDAIHRGYKVAVAPDAISSRTTADKDAGIEKMRASGVMINTTEMVIFDILERAGTPEFKEIAPLLK
jgi:nicotinamidase-related amidase